MQPDTFQGLLEADLSGNRLAGEHALLGATTPDAAPPATQCAPGTRALRSIP